MADYSIEAELKANARKFKKAIEQAKEVTEKFKRASESVEDTKLNADVKPLKRNMKVAKKLMEAFTKEKAEKEIDADTVSFFRKVAQLQAKARALTREKIVIPFEAKVDEFQKKMDRLARTINSVGTVAANAFKGGLLSLLPTLSPIIASLTGALGGLASSFASAGTGAVAFGSVATTALNDVFAANEDIQKLREQLANTTDLEERAKITKQIEQATAGLSKSQQKGLKAVQSFSKFWSKFAKQFEKPVMNVFIRSLEGLQKLIKQLEPAFQGAVNAVDTLSKSMGQAIQTKEFQAFVTFLNTSVEPTMVNLGKVFGNVMQGMMNLMVAFGPFAADMQTGLVGLTEKFKKWTAGLKDSKAFHTFIDYVKENGPKVIALIGNLTTYLIELGKGMAPLGSKLFDLVNGFLSWTNSMMQSFPWLGQLIAGLTSFLGAAIAIAPPLLLLKTTFSGVFSTIGNVFMKIWAKIKPLFTEFRTVVTRLGAQALPLLRAAFIALTGPIGIIIGVLSLLIPVFVRLWKENEAFRQGVQTAWTFIQNIFTTVINFISNLVKTVIGALVTWWQENQEKFKSIAKKAWDAVYNVVKTVLTTVWDIVKQIVTRIQEFWSAHGDTIVSIAKTAWNIISTVVSTVTGVIWTVIQNALSFIQGLFETVWPIISDVVEVAWGVIETAVQTGIDLVSGIINTVMDIIKGDWEGAWESIKKTAETIMDNIVGFFEDIDLMDIGKDIIKGLINGIGSMGEAAWNAAKGIGEEIKNSFTSFFGISSPSKVMRKDVGRWVTSGVSEGILKQIRSVKKSSQAVSNAVTKSFNPDLSIRASQIKSSLRGIKRNATARVQNAVNTEVSVGKQPAYIHVRIGKQEFIRFVDDIDEQQKRNAFSDEKMKW
ncbi:hypothetical protein [Virgibacillus salexigens]|uniref:hypothetical protein n=1 Tax=Virgibacillus salexigens TaxID=61016 RepID=UPI00190A1A16|nr:hypothetical protein [Virgibacillus salexigens]